MDGLPSVGIIGTGACVPGTASVPIPRQRGGTDQRSAPAIAAAAARRALDTAGLAPQGLSHVVVAACARGAEQPDAAGVRQLIGAGRAAAFDTTALYGGFVHALTMAEGVLRAEPPTAYALVVGVGKGAGAVVLGPVPRGRGTISTSLLTGSDLGAAFDDALTRAGVARQQVRHVLVEEPAVSVPVALDRLSRQGLLADGDIVALCGWDRGGTVGCGLVRWAGAQAAGIWAPAKARSIDTSDRSQ
jgi:3-oxoacyl-[acyl-carrier-protein] synthase III